MDSLSQICERLNYPREAELRRCVEEMGYDTRDIAGVEKLGRWYNLEYPGICRLLNLFLDEFITLFSSFDGLRVYASVPCPSVLGNALNSTGSIRFFTAEFCAMVVTQGILGIAPEPSYDHKNVSCAMMDNRRAFVLENRLPKPDVMWGFGLLCDECCKSDEFIEAVADIPQLHSICGKVWEKRRFERYEENLRENLNDICKQAGVPVPDGRAAKRTANRAAILISYISCFNSGAENPPLKAASMALIHSCNLMCFFRHEALPDCLSEIYKDIKSAKPEGERKKLYCYYIPPCIPELGSIFDDAGIRLIGDAAFITRPISGTFSDDLAGFAAAAWHSSILSRSSHEYAEETAGMIDKYDCIGYLNGMFYFDKWLGAGHKMTDGQIQALSGKPVYDCHTDFWGRSFSEERAALLAETIALL